MNESNSLQLVVGLTNGDGKLLIAQPLDEFLNGRRNISILNIYTGRKLFDILVDDLGVIRYVDNKFVLTTIFQNDPHSTAMRLLGKIAEAVIVRRCHEDEKMNKKWFSIARRRSTRIDVASRFQAVGTGLEKTKKIWSRRYNPSDPQRDIIWIDFRSGFVANMAGSTQSAGIEAGLQIKVSNNGCQYFLNDLYNIRYEVPVVYFDINSDFEIVANKLIEYRQRKGENILINKDFVCAKAIDFDAFQEVHYYFDLVIALLEKRIQPIDLINKAENYDSLMTAISAAGLESIGIETQMFK